MERPMNATVGTRASASGTVVDARMSLALWLRTGRAQRGMSLADVARVTKIQPRILERLEAGKLDGLPPDVFVRGFMRSVARCVGLDETEAVKRYSDAAGQPVTPAARALIDSMAELAPTTARAHIAPQVLLDRTEPVVEAVVEAVVVEAPVVEAVVVEAPVVEAVVVEAVVVEAPVIEAPVIEALVVEAGAAEADSVEAPSSKKRRRRATKGRKRKALAVGTSDSPVVAATAVAEPDDVAVIADAVTAELAVEPVAEPVPVPVVAAPTVVEPVATAEQPWQPKMPTTVAPMVPWRRPAHAVKPMSMARIIPSLVIDDADPENAERELEERAAKAEPARRSFLPPILMDREDRSARQGGLTLAVIIVLIAATLTLSYLMRRPSSSGDGVTQTTPTSTSELA